MIMTEHVGEVLAIATRSVRRGPMFETRQVEAYGDACLEGDHGSSSRRGLTLLAEQQWQQVMSQLGVDLPWHTRRANLLIRADTLVPVIGKIIHIGVVSVHVHAETKPCGEMDRYYPGLCEALTADCRGGVYGHILNSGLIQVGDVVTVGS